MEDFTCRICFDNEKKSKLLMPCKCNQPIHKRCLKKWMKIKKNPEYCEVCKEKYNVDFIVISNNNDIDYNTIDEWDRLNENNLTLFLASKKFILFLLLVILICIILIFIELKIQIDNNNLDNYSIPEGPLPENSSP